MAAPSFIPTALCTLLVTTPVMSVTQAAEPSPDPSSLHAADSATDSAIDAEPASPVGFVVLRENGAGSASAAQSYLDSLFASIAKRNGWAAAAGKYFTKRSKAETYIEQTKPAFGFLSFGAYLGMRKAHDLRPLAVANAGAAGGAQYFVVSKAHVSLEQCKGKTLASNHAGNARFIDAVVSGEDFDLGDFEVVATRRPVQTIKAVINDEAACALVDDSQIVAMSKVDGGALLRPVWSSSELPSVVVVAFGRADARTVGVFEKNVEKMCQGDGRSACDAAGLDSPRKVTKNAFAAEQAAYDR